LRFASIGFLLALLLVPLTLATHNHSGSVASDSCARCVAVHHTPTLATPPPGVIASWAGRVAVVSRPPDVRVWAERMALSGRGPPTPAVS